MTKILFGLGIIIFFTCNSFGSTQLNFSYGGETFLLGKFSGQYGKLGLDLYYIQQKIGEVIQKSYAIAPYCSAWDLIKEDKFLLTGFIGFGIAQAFYDNTQSSIDFSPNIGLIGEYKLSSKFFIDGKGIMFTYQDGFNIPWNIALNYCLTKKLSLSFGLGSLTSLTIDKTMSFLYKFGGLVGVKYEF